jgi:type VI protein secretion system component Hcp
MATNADVGTTDKKSVEYAFYLKLEGLQGSATTPGYEGWIPLHSFQFGVGVGIGSPSRRTPKAAKKQLTEDEEEAEAIAAAAGDIIVDETEEEAFYRSVRESNTRISSPSISEVSLTKLTDATSPLLFLHTSLRKPFRRAIIEQIYDRTTIRITLGPAVFVSGFSVSADNGPEDDDNAPSVESFSLNFQEVEMSVVDKVRRPLALPKTPSFTGFNPHQAREESFPLPVELITSIFWWLDQQSLSRASMVRLLPWQVMMTPRAVRCCAQA